MNDQAPHSIAQPSFSGGSFLPLISGGLSVTYSHYSELVTMCEGGSIQQVSKAGSLCKI